MQPFRQLAAAWRSDAAAVATPALVFLVALLVLTRGLGWGLPAGDETWAADAIRPSAPLSVAYQNFVAGGWNSGWFWFKYPPFHALLLAALYAPVLAWTWLGGGLQGFSSEYPFGLVDPVATLSSLALVGRGASAVLGAGCVLLVYLCTVRTFGRVAAVAAAFATAFAYPMVFYAQTTNVEVPYLFWMLLALLAAVRLAEGDERRLWWLLLGCGAALSVSTKELAAGAFVGIPLALVPIYWSARRPAAHWLRGGLIAACAFGIALLVANNALFNPLGFARRVGFLTQTLPQEIVLQYAPYNFPIDLGGARGLAAEVGQLALAARRVQESLGWPTLVLSVAGWLIALRRRPRWALLLLAVACTYYLVSARAMMSLSMRYLLPITVLCTTMAGVALAELLREGRGRAPRIGLAAAAAVFIVAYGWDVNRMLTGDGRLAAEAWLQANAAAATRIETYQNSTYLPRFPAGLRVEDIAFERRDIASFSQRAPDLVVLSSSGLSGVTVRYKMDWQDGAAVPEGFVPDYRSASGTVMSYRKVANTEFLEALTTGRLGYEEVARFLVDPWVPRPLIQSLNPEITIYRRRTAGFAPSARPTDSPASGTSPRQSEEP